MLRLTLLQGSYADFGTGTVLVSKKAAADRHYRLGQVLTFGFPRGPERLRVVGIHDSVIANYVTTLSTLQQGGFAREDSSVLVKVQPGASTVDVKAELERATARLPIITVKDQREYAAEQRAPIDRLVLIIYALLGLALVIAVLGVVNTLGLSVVERTREIGLLRAIGVDRRQMRRMISLESVAIAVLGALLGIAMGLVFGVALTASLRDQGLTVTRVPWVSLAAYLLAAVVDRAAGGPAPGPSRGPARRAPSHRGGVNLRDFWPLRSTNVSRLARFCWCRPDEGAHRWRRSTPLGAAAGAGASTCWCASTSAR